MTYGVIPQKILVIALKYLGDVLLTTPLIHSLKVAYPSARIDVLVYTNTAGMLQGNPDIDSIIIQSARPRGKELRVLIAKIFRQYDLAICTQVGDRSIIFSLLAAPFTIAHVPPKGTKGWWKRYLVQCWIAFDDEHTHTVLQHLKLLDLLGIPKYYALVPPQTEKPPNLPFLTEQQAFVVLHICPQWQYKRWTVAGWIAVGHYLSRLGFRLVLSGGTASDELAYIDEVFKQLPADTISIAGQVSLAELNHILLKARLFIGPDTGITHLAAATGIPVIALFGPTNPVKWAPWPVDYHQDKNPFNKQGSQHLHNVDLIQGIGECVPCHLEGCDRHQQSRSECLESLAVDRVNAVIDQIINRP